MGFFGGSPGRYFGSIRGTNEFEDHDVVIILGGEQSSARDAERLAKAIWYDTKRPIRCIEADKKGQVQYPRSWLPYKMRDGTRREVPVRVHTDRRVQAVVEQIREAEMIQAIDRLRLIHNEKCKTVYILCGIPLDIPVDELVTWKQLAGDRRLSDALAECDERGWDALPLAAKALCRLLPKLWGSPKTVERWLAKNPLEAYRDIIRVWGVFVDFKPRWQRRWSEALVRHGADPAVALAEVLGVSAEDIRLRDRPE